jgi:adenine-specific DNA-methyltransferase
VINLNKNYGSKRKYILIEQGEYFDTVTKPRIQKVVFSENWVDGKVEGLSSKQSHAFKVIKIESYEDTLSNLKLGKSQLQEDLLSGFVDEVKGDYLLRYMLDVESRGSLLSVEDFKNPFNYSLNIAVDSAGACEQRKVDLVETFNYLIGLRVKHIDAQPQRGFVTVTGTLPSGESCLVLWRDCEKIDYDELRRMANRLDIEAANNPYSVIYINGDHNIPSVVESTEEEGSGSKKLMLLQIEPAFLDAMFKVDDV